MMRKKLFGMLLAALCLLGCASASAGVAYDPFEAVNGSIYGVAFALPGMPVAVVQEHPLEGCWTEAVQLVGNCLEDGAEYQLRAADIAPWIDGCIRENPDRSQTECVFSALYQFASFYINRYNGSTDRPMADARNKLMTFTYTYPDTPGETYRAKCFLNGTKAVCLFMQECEHCDRAMESLARLQEDQPKAAEQPYWMNFYGLSMIFPREPVLIENEKSYSTICFAEDFTRIVAEYVPLGLTVNADAAEAESVMKDMTEQAMACVGGGTLQSGELSGDTDLWCYDFVFIHDHPFAEAAPTEFTWRGRVYTGEDGIWYLLCADTETGREWLDSVGVPDITTPDVGFHAKDADARAERAVGNAPVSLQSFCSDLVALIRADQAANDRMIDLAAWVSDAVWSNGGWVRTMSLGSADAYLLLFVSSDDEQALINEIHVISALESKEGTFRKIAEVSAAAAAGKDAPSVCGLRERFEKGEKTLSIPDDRYAMSVSRVTDRGSMDYDLLTLKAARPAALRHTPKEEDYPDTFAAPGMTVRQFRDRWEKLRLNSLNGDFALTVEGVTEAKDGRFLFPHVIGEGTRIVPVTEVNSIDAPITQIMILNMNENCPETYLGGLMAHAVLTEMPRMQFLSITLMLEEYPLWNDLLFMDPIVGWRGKKLLLNGDFVDGVYVPKAYVMDMGFEGE